LSRKIRAPLIAIAAVFASALVLWVGVFVYVRASDQCFIGYDDQRLIDIATKYEISAGKRKIDSDHEPYLINYQSIEEFKDRNKRCCSISRSHFEYTYLLDRVIGQTEVWVSFWYRAKSEGAEPFYLSDVILNNCGKIIASRGISSAQGPTAK
jgi:hypothetical protein